MSQPIQSESLAAPRFEALLNQCVRCGVCLPACPTYAVFGTEMDSPRAYVNDLRQRALNAGGYAVVMRAPKAWLQDLDLSGYRPEALDLMVKLRAGWDSGGILNPD